MAHAGTMLLELGQTPPAASAAPMNPQADVVSSNPSAFGGIYINDFLGATTFYQYGFVGYNAIVANVEAGYVWNGHVDLSGRTDAYGTHISQVQLIPTVADSSGQFDFHATAVGSVLAGQGQYTANFGMAGYATLYSGAIASGWNSDPQNPAFSGSFNASDAAFAGTYAKAMLTGMGGVTNTGVTNPTADVINSSWGYPDPTGISNWTMGIDSLVNTSHKVMVVAAGNDGPGTNTVAGPASGYNVIRVGALGNSNSYNTVADFSSRGPNDWFQATSPTTGNVVTGVRSTVDILAPGTDITASYYGGPTGGNTTGLEQVGGANNYYISGLAGTSLATPLVSGGAALLVDAGKYAYWYDSNAIDGQVIKAVLLNSATKLAGWTNNLTMNSNGVLTTTQGLDYTQGAGRMNLTNAYAQFMTTAWGGEVTNPDAQSAGDVMNAGSIGWGLGNVNLGSYKRYFIENYEAAGDTLTTTLDWFVNRLASVGAVSADAGAFADAQEVTFADLSLKIFEYDPLTGNIIKQVALADALADNTEQLYFNLAEGGYYGIEVDYNGNHWDFSSTAQTSQQFGLAWSITPEPSRVLFLMIGMIMGLIRRRR